MGVPRASCEEPGARSVDTRWEGQPGFAGSGFSKVLRSGPLLGTLAPRESAAAFLHTLVNNPRRQAVLALSNLNLSCHGRAGSPAFWGSLLSVLAVGRPLALMPFAGHTKGRSAFEASASPQPQWAPVS